MSNKSTLTYIQFGDEQRLVRLGTLPYGNTGPTSIHLEAALVRVGNRRDIPIEDVLNYHMENCTTHTVIIDDANLLDALMSIKECCQTGATVCGALRRFGNSGSRGGLLRRNYRAKFDRVVDVSADLVMPLIALLANEKDVSEQQTLYRRLAMTLGLIDEAGLTAHDNYDEPLDD